MDRQHILHLSVLTAVNCKYEKWQKKVHSLRLHGADSTSEKPSQSCVCVSLSRSVCLASLSLCVCVFVFAFYPLYVDEAVL